MRRARLLLGRRKRREEGQLEPRQPEDAEGEPDHQRDDQATPRKGGEDAWRCRRPRLGEN